MKLVDNRGRQEEAESFGTMTEEAEFVETDSRKIAVRMDWRIYNQVVPVIDKATWGFNNRNSRSKLLTTAIKNRRELKEIVLMDYDREQAHKQDQRQSLQCEVSEDILEELIDEAHDLRLSLDEYMRAIVYTYAKQEREQSEQHEAATKQDRYANRIVEVGSGVIEKDLREKLLELYPMTEEEKTFNRGMNIADEGLGERLVKLAKAHLKL